MKRRKLISRHRGERKHIFVKIARNKNKYLCDVMEEKPIHTEKRSIREIWNQVLEIMEGEIGIVSFETWIHPCKVLAFIDNKLVLVVEHELIKDTIEKRFLRKLNAALKTVIREKAEVVLVLEGRK